MGWFGKLLGTDKALDVIDTVAKGGLDLLDNAFYTDEEKANIRMKQANLWLKMHDTVAKQSAPTAISRRIIAWAVVGMAMFSLLVGTVLLFLKMDEMLVKFLDLVSTVGITTAFPLVIGFYFGPHIFSSMSGKK